MPERDRILRFAFSFCSAKIFRSRSSSLHYYDAPGRDATGDDTTSQRACPMRIASLTISLFLTTAAFGQEPANASAAERAGASFDTPIELKTGGEPFRNVRYPAPMLHDIDGDGREELVIGDLYGYIWVSERKDGAHDFGPMTKLEAEGRALKFNNW